MDDREPCEFCGGRGYIRLPRMFKRLSPIAPSSNIAAELITESSKEFVCPECGGGSDNVDDNFVHVFVAEARLTNHLPEVEARRYLEGYLTSNLAHAIIKNDFLTISVGKPGSGGDYDTRKVVARCGLVSKRTVATIEQRAIDKLQTMLPAAADRAEEDIRNWGSHYTGKSGAINKDDAVRMMREAFGQHLKFISGAE